MKDIFSTTSFGLREKDAERHVIPTVAEELSRDTYVEEIPSSDHGRRSSVRSDILSCGISCILDEFSVGQYAHAKSENYPSKRNKSSTAPPATWVPKDFSEPETILGSGKFADVHLCFDMESRCPLALKKMEKESASSVTKQCWKREVEIQTRLSHESILNCHGYFQTKCQITVVLEYSPCGDLSTYLSKNSISISRSARFIKQITSALKYLNQRKIAHRDVKTENILLMDYETAKLADFGFAVNCQLSDRRSTCCGTLACLPPEILLFEEYNALFVDSWSLGVMAYEVVLRKDLFKSSTKSSLKSLITGFRDRTIEENTYLSGIGPDFHNFVCSLLQKNPIDRLSPSEALDHVWFAKANSRSNKIKVSSKSSYHTKAHIGKQKHRRTRRRHARVINPGDKPGVSQTILWRVGAKVA